MRLALIFPVAALALSACAASTATVISSNGPTIAQAQAEPENGRKPRIAVQPFESRTQNGNIGIGAGLADMLSDSLFNTNKFIVVERR